MEGCRPRPRPRRRMLVCLLHAGNNPSSRRRIFPQANTNPQKSVVPTPNLFQCHSSSNKLLIDGYSRTVWMPTSHNPPNAEGHLKKLQRSSHSATTHKETRRQMVSNSHRSPTAVSVPLPPTYSRSCAYPTVAPSHCEPDVVPSGQV